MIERSQHLRFALEAAHTIRIARELVRENLDCHFTLEFRIARAIYGAHSALAQQRRDFMGAEVCTDADRQVQLLVWY